jgi:signal transduction histidine kinase
MRVPQRTIRLRLTAVYGGLFVACGTGLLATTYLLVLHATAGTYTYTGKDGRTTGVSVTTTGHGPADSGTVPRVHTDGTGKALSPAQAEALAQQMQRLAEQQHAHEMHQLLIQSGIALAIMTAVSVLLGWLVAGRVLRPLRTITAAATSISATNLHERLALAGPDDEVRRLGDTMDRLLARLEAAFTAQRRFVANASHELRTPLTLVRALLQMTLTDPDATVADYRTTCREAIAETDRQEHIIEALLVLARSERGLDHREPLDLAAVADGVLAARNPRDIEVRRATDPAPLDGDPRLAERLVANLLDNALRHNSTGGHVTVTTGTRGSRPFLTVTNTGPVVPADAVPRLYQPFQRLGTDAAHHPDGLGLGLSIVQAIATAHDATITTRPRPTGGLHIDITFPPPRTSAPAPA